MIGKYCYAGRFVCVAAHAPRFLPLSVSSICGAFLWSVQRKKTTHICDHHQEVRVRWELRQREVQGGLNKQICSVIHNLPQQWCLTGDVKLQLNL